MPLTVRCALAIVISLSALGATAHAADTTTPESVIRALVTANANKDLATMSRHMAHDADVVGYTIGGRKYVGWDAFAAEMEQEFASVRALELPISELHVWTSGAVAWFAMELDYIRHLDNQHEPMRLALRETGVLERRDGQWTLVAWHESARTAEALTTPILTAPPSPRAITVAVGEIDVAGQWEIQEEDKTYVATLDKNGNGTYTHQGGRIVTTQLADRKWQGTWHQTGNDREGGFDLLLSEDGTEARGIWWYTRVGDRKNIPPRQHGGTYLWKRVSGRATQ